MLSFRDWRFTRYLPTYGIINFPFVFVVKKRISDNRFLGYCRPSRADFAQKIKKVVQTKFKTSSLSISHLKNNVKNLKRERIIHQNEISLKQDNDLPTVIAN